MPFIVVAAVSVFECWQTASEGSRPSIGPRREPPACWPPRVPKLRCWQPCGSGAVSHHRVPPRGRSVRRARRHPSTPPPLASGQGGWGWSLCRSLVYEGRNILWPSAFALHLPLLCVDRVRSLRELRCMSFYTRVPIQEAASHPRKGSRPRRKRVTLGK